MGDAALLIETQAQHLSKIRIPVVLSGGLTNDPLTIEYLKSALHTSERFEIRILDKEPVDGAVMLARKRYLEKTGGNFICQKQK